MRGKTCLLAVAAAFALPGVAPADSTPRWQLFAGAPAMHLGVVTPIGEYLGGYESTWALGVTMRAERRGRGRPWAGELAVQALSSAGVDLVVDRPVQARAGFGPLFTPAAGRSAELRLSPRLGVVYGHYEFFGFVGAWSGLMLDGLWWLTGRVAASVGIEARAGYWSTVYQDFYQVDDAGVLMAVEALVGVIVRL